MTLKNNVQGSLTDYWDRTDTKNISEPEKMKAELKGVLETLIEASYNRLPESLPGENKEDYSKQVNEYVSSEGFQKRVNQITEEYEKLHNQHKKAMAVRTSSLDVDLIEKRRLLIFRMVTALGFAAVLLFTGYLAKKWEIPLPLLRLVGA